MNFRNVSCEIAKIIQREVDDSWNAGVRAGIRALERAISNLETQHKLVEPTSNETLIAWMRDDFETLTRLLKDKAMPKGPQNERELREEISRRLEVIHEDGFGDVVPVIRKALFDINSKIDWSLVLEEWRAQHPNEY